MVLSPPWNFLVWACSVDMVGDCAGVGVSNANCQWWVLCDCVPKRGCCWRVSSCRVAGRQVSSDDGIACGGLKTDARGPPPSLTRDRPPCSRAWRHSPRRFSISDRERRRRLRRARRTTTSTTDTANPSPTMRYIHSQEELDIPEGGTSPPHPPRYTHTRARGGGEALKGTNSQ
jgi:hypothetical protein